MKVAWAPPLSPARSPPRPRRPHRPPAPADPQDTWLPDQVAFVQAVGNARANAYWEETLPADFRRPPESDMSALRMYITDKYVHRRYAAQGYSEPPSIDNYATHPVSGGGGEF